MSGVVYLPSRKSIMIPFLNTIRASKYSKINAFIYLSILLKHICDQVRSGMLMSSRSQDTTPPLEVSDLVTVIGFAEARPREISRRNFILTSDYETDSERADEQHYTVVAFIAIFTNCCIGRLDSLLVTTN